MANHIAKYMADKQLLDAGEYKAIARHNEIALKNIRAADLARRGVPVGGVRDDTNDRDN